MATTIHEVGMCIEGTHMNIEEAPVTSNERDKGQSAGKPNPLQTVGSRRH